MQDFRYNGKIVEVWQVSGEVAGNTTISETEVNGSGGGGGGYVGPQGGRIQPSSVSISSTVSHLREFWIKEANGRETSFKLKNVEIPLRDGQAVTALGVKIKGQDQGFYVTLINHNSGTQHHLTPIAAVVDGLHLEPHLGARVLYGICAYFAISWLTGSGIFGLGAAIIALVVGWIRRNYRKARTGEALRRHLSMLQN